MSRTSPNSQPRCSVRAATWMFGEAPEGLAEQVRATGGLWVAGGPDPLAELVGAQRLAVAVAAARGLDPDQPRHLTRSVILTTPYHALMGEPMPHRA